MLRGWKAHDKDINSIDVSPNESLVASASQDRTVKLWLVETGALTLTCKGHKRGVWCVKFSPVDKVVASASADATIKLWSVTDGACLKTFEGHEGSVLKTVFVSSGMQLLSSGSDGLLKLWTIKTCECVASFDEHEDKVWALAAAADDDSLVATGAGDGLVHLWSDTTGELQDQARADSEERLALEQELSNALRAKDVRKAALLALRLNQPLRLLGVVKDVLLAGGEEAPKILSDVAGALNFEQVGQMLGYMRDWNTTARNAGAAQGMLHAIFVTWPPHQLEKVEEMKGLVDALIPYTQRHLTRLEESMQRSYMLDFTLHAMQTSLGGDDGFEVEAQALPLSVRRVAARRRAGGDEDEGALAEEGRKDDGEEGGDEVGGGHRVTDVEESEEEEDAASEEEGQEEGGEDGEDGEDSWESDGDGSGAEVLEEQEMRSLRKRQREAPSPALSVLSSPRSAKAAPGRGKSKAKGKQQSTKKKDTKFSAGGGGGGVASTPRQGSGRGNAKLATADKPVGSVRVRQPVKRMRMSL